jgi:hypothetical protein
LVWVFSDQNFPPIIPAGEDATCLKIIRTEGEDLLQSISKFLVKYGHAIGNKDVVLVGSANQLLREGLEGYVASVLDAIDRLSVGSRKNCTVLPAPVILLEGCKEQLLIKYMFDFHAWIRISGIDRAGVLNDAMGTIEHYLLFSQHEKVCWPGMNFKLPLDLPSRKKACVSVPGSANLPIGADPVPEHIEKLIMHALLASINENFGTNLDSDPSTPRQLANSIKECHDFITIGGAHAEATAVKLREMGIRCQYLHAPHYRASSVHAGKIKESLNKLKTDENTILVLQIFESSFFWVKTEEGGLIPPCRRSDGSYHIDGELEIVNREMQFGLFKQLMDELLGHRSNKLILMAPLPMYLEEGCCGDEDHVANRKQEDYKKKQEEAVFAARQNLKNFAFRQGLRRCVTVSAWGKVRRLDEIWDGPTRLTEAGYKNMAEAVIAAAVSLQNKRKAESTSGDSRKKQSGTGQHTENIH